MANQKLSDFSTSVTTPGATDLLLMEQSSTHKKITFATLTQDLVSNTVRQVFGFANRKLTQSEIQNLNTTPIEIVASPGNAEKYIQVLGCSAFHDHNGTNYSGGVNIALRMPTLGDVWRIASIINATSDKIQEGASFESAMTFNDNLQIQGSADSTGAGGTIHVFVQYVTIFTGTIV